MMRMFEEPVEIVYAPVHAALHPKEYRCDACGGVFGEGWSDEAAVAESAALFGDIPADDRAKVCDDCFRLICPAGDS